MNPDQQIYSKEVLAEVEKQLPLTPEQEFAKRLDEIEAKYAGRELTAEEKTQRVLELKKIEMDSIKKFNELWKNIPRKNKRKMIPKKHSYSNRVKQILK